MFLFDRTKMVVFAEKEVPSNYLVFIAQTVRPDFPHFKSMKYFQKEICLVFVT